VNWILYRHIFGFQSHQHPAQFPFLWWTLSRSFWRTLARKLEISDHMLLRPPGSRIVLNREHASTNMFFWCRQAYTCHDIICAYDRNKSLWAVKIGRQACIESDTDVAGIMWNPHAYCVNQSLFCLPGNFSWFRRVYLGLDACWWKRVSTKVNLSEK
jgi:hypothetical protein